MIIRYPLPVCFPWSTVVVTKNKKVGYKNDNIPTLFQMLSQDELMKLNPRDTAWVRISGDSMINRCPFMNPHKIEGFVLVQIDVNRFAKFEERNDGKIGWQGGGFKVLDTPRRFGGLFKICAERRLLVELEKNLYSLFIPGRSYPRPDWSSGFAEA